MRKASRRILAGGLFALGAALATLSGCGPAVTLRVLQPAEKTVPSHIQTVAVLDRSRPSNVGEGFLGVMEGLVTGEAIGVDTEGRQEAINGLLDVLEESPRYQIVIPMVDREQADSHLFETTIDWEAADAICARVGCEGIVALEAFDSDSHVDHEVETRTKKDDDGNEKKIRVHVVQRQTRVMAAWRIYDVVNSRVIDDDWDHSVAETWDAEGKTESDARGRLPSQYDTVCDLAYRSGDDYARRIAPAWIYVRRAYYASGDSRLKDAKFAVKDGDWETASRIWEGMLDDADAKLRGKAGYNLALAREQAGLLGEALDLATVAGEAWDKARIRNYRWILEQRMMDEDKLMRQLEGTGVAP